MKKRNAKHEKRVRKLVVMCALFALLLTVSTYAWFIGMQTVNVSSFDVNIATTDSLYLSLDGNEWTTELAINEDNYNDDAYEGNTNSWGNGLVPMSSVGTIDTAASRLVLYEKGSLTATPGGYRLMASQVDNSKEEHAGYVAFDLFIKNLSGDAYYTDLTVDNEEAIYLTPESTVAVGTSGVENTGIENSVRVAFAQIGRVKATSEASVITAITCTSDDNVTGICADRTATIWEPNDTKHVNNAINWYTESCKKRIAKDLTLTTSYDGVCGTIQDGTAYATYAVSGEIVETDKVDVYDGEIYNTYKDSIAEEPTTGKLMAVDTFTDTEKDKEGTERPEFMTLAPNSVTKVRVYIYIEGQDIDNYDFASLGKQISVSFGFTKERFYGEDVNYDGDPELPEGLQSRDETTDDSQSDAGDDDQSTT